MSNVHQKTDDN